LPVHMGDKLIDEGARMPLSVLNLDIRGEDIENSPLVFESGDADGVLRPTERGFVPMPWAATPAALLPMSMYHDDGTPFEGDARHALKAVVERFAAKGWTPVVATELEFFLVDDSGKTLRPPRSPRSGKRRLGGEILSMRALDAFDDFFSELYEACAAMDIPAEATISEGGLGQYEVNLSHVADAMKAADDAWLFKLLVKGIARKHGVAATCMAKPYPEEAGNGMHTHFSVLDRDGRNIFDDGGVEGSALLRHAIGGCLAAMPGSTLIFAPHANSYERFTPGAHAPTGLAWGYENRTAAIRVPGGAPAARRIEHRVAGGDINPYLMLSMVLGAALIGIEDQRGAPEPITGSAYEAGLEEIPNTWEAALKAFQEDPFIPRILPQALSQNLILTKKQEMALVDNLSKQKQLALYLDTV
ncbi:MAG: glutamine synthetase family protein, partial [Litoreibacter sp.]|nr:glutamine synthetase family protein [Litoreibacter sp.]